LSQQLTPSSLAGRTRAFVIGGENLLAESVQVWREFAPKTRLINEYGPTETVVGCCVYEVAPNDPHTGSIPIGRSIANTQLYVLGPDLAPVELGETGELYIGGAGVARGYLNRPELTRERFLPDPFSQKEGAHLYKTGDLARYRADGVLEYLGRIDNQVKVRGYRIELGEIEATLAAHPDVQSCAVLAREDTPGNKQLVGYVVLRAPATDTGELTEFLGQRLAEYMVPTHFVRLDAMPLTENGKVDRKALPAVSQIEDAIAAKRFVAPRNDTETVLAEIWAKLLNVAAVGVDDDFFGLGAHSLLIIKAVSRIRDALGVEVPAQDVFERSTVAGLAVVVSKLRGDQTEKATTATPPAPSPEVLRVPQRTPDGPCPLSFAQEQFWLLDQMVPGSPAYNIVDVIDLGGAYHAQALHRTMDELLRRHTVLRASFSVGEEELRQSIASFSSLPVQETDLCALPENERASAWSHIVREQGRKPFDLTKPPLIRATVVHHSPEDHRLLLVLHHIVGDEWAMGILQSETRQIYEAFAKNQTHALPELPIQYADFACWQRKHFQGDRLKEQLDYWNEALADASPVLQLPIDKPRSAALSFRGATEQFLLPKTTHHRLQGLARAEQSTLFMVLEAAFASFLHRYSGQPDVLIGTPISGRMQSETQNLVGCFLNTVVLRSQFDDRQTFRNLVKQTRERALGAFAHAELPFGRLVATLAPDRDPSRTPLFQVMFVLFDSEGASSISNVSRHRELENGTSKFDITLFISITDDGLACEMEYSTDIFEAETIRRMCRHFGVLLDGLLRLPDAPITELPILTDADTRQLMEWNRTESDYPRDVSLACLIEAQVERAPNAIAVSFGGQSLTYSELNASANQLARELQARGVGPDGIVAILVERSVEMMVGLLAIVKAGGAYLPLDPFLPPERLRTMLDDSGARAVLTQDAFKATLSTFGGAVCSLDDPTWRSQSRANLDVAVTPEHLAYVLYTSGSTGKPKGVEVPRGALTNLLWSMREWLGLGPQDRLLAVTTIAFDIAGVDMWLPLLVGARVVIASREESFNGDRLREQITQEGITFMQATPVTWRLLLAAGWQGKVDIQVVCTGEALPQELAGALAPLVRRLWNLYGPTETTIWSTGYLVRDGNAPVLIGRPVANTKCYVLDANRQEVPIGVVGELYLGGAGLARGYLGRPELTAEKFIADPFGAAGGRLYRTGDLACYQPDGNLICLGRVDHQVKIRGFRIELGEIETALAQHPAVQQAAVVVREDIPGDKRLVAYVVAQNSPLDLVEQLQRRLRATLPEYMVPSHVMVLDAFPLSPNGKVDRKALPAPQVQPAAAPGRAPGTDTEKRIAEIWRTLLKRDGIGIDDDFFDVGGHSLLGVMLVTEIEKHLGPRLPLSQILRSPTVAGLARAVDAIGERKHDIVPGDDDGIVAIRPGGAKRLFFVYDGIGEVMPYFNLARRLPADYSVYGLLPRRLPRVPLAHLSVPDMANHCIQQMRRQQPTGPYEIGGLCAGGVIAFAMAEQLERSGDAVDYVLLLDAIAPTTAMKRWRTTSERWKRFSSAIRRARQSHYTVEHPQNAAASAPAEHDHTGVATESLRKLHNLLHYEARQVVRSAFVALRVRLLERILTRGADWPAWLPELAAREIYEKVKDLYHPGQVNARLVLVRAHDGSGNDLPAADVVVDPLLGWGDRSRRGLDVIDAPGGHSSMLQEPHVGSVAERLMVSLVTATEDNPIGGQTKAHAARR